MEDDLKFVLTYSQCFIEDGTTDVVKGTDWMTLGKYVHLCGLDSLLSHFVGRIYLFPVAIDLNFHALSPRSLFLYSIKNIMGMSVGL